MQTRYLRQTVAMSRRPLGRIRTQPTRFETSVGSLKKFYHHHRDPVAGELHVELPVRPVARLSLQASGPSHQGVVLRRVEVPQVEAADEVGRRKGNSCTRTGRHSREPRAPSAISNGAPGAAALPKNAPGGSRLISTSSPILSQVLLDDLCGRDLARHVGSSRGTALPLLVCPRARARALAKFGPSQRVDVGVPETRVS